MKATFAAGCFWGVQDAFEEVAGVTSAVAGYAVLSRGGIPPALPQEESLLSGLPGVVS